MINRGTLAKYSQVEMLLGAILNDMRVKVIMKLELDPRDPSTLKYNKRRMHLLDECATTNALAHLHLEGAYTAPGVSPYSIPAAVPLPQMPVVVNLPAIPNKETPAAAQPTEEIAIANAVNTIDTKMDNMIMALEAWTFQLSKANEPRYGGYQTARA